MPEGIDMEDEDGGVYSLRNCYRAYSKAKRGHSKSPGALKWIADPYARCYALESKLSSRIYEYGPYHDFYVYEPKKRLVQAVSFEDKVAQHILCDEVL